MNAAPAAAASVVIGRQSRRQPGLSRQPSAQGASADVGPIPQKLFMARECGPRSNFTPMLTHWSDFVRDHVAIFLRQAPVLRLNAVTAMRHVGAWRLCCFGRTALHSFYSLRCCISFCSV
jgi:hypothetical protein